MSQRHPARGSLTAEQVRDACMAPSTKKSYASYLNCLAKWIRETQQNPERFFRVDDGAIDVTVFTPDVLDDFFVSKLNSGALKVSTLGGYRSAVRSLYVKYDAPLPVSYQGQLKTLFKGMNRIEAEEIQEAGVSTKPGKQPLTYSLYEQLCKATLGLPDSGFAHLFLTTQWNLMCRSKSVETIHLSHLVSADDSIGCVLHKTKTNQEGTGPKDPRHMYANPFSPQTCWVLALGLYLASNPSIGDGKLFPGSDQKGRFAKVLSGLISELTDSKTFGTHSIRKGVATFSCSASTGGPSIVSVCLRCGWSLGGVQDRYFRYESAGDQYLGRVVAGLPINSFDFATLPPHFTDPSDGIVRDTISKTFPALQSSPHLQPILQLCLASLVKHSEFLRENLPVTHPFRSSYLWSSRRIVELQANLNGMGLTRLAKPWQGCSAWRPNRRHIKRALGHKLRAAGREAIRVREQRWKDSDAAIAEALAVVPWHRFVRQAGLSPHETQLWTRLRHHQLQVWGTSETGGVCAREECDSNSKAGPAHITWHCPAAQSLWKNVRRLWGADNVTDHDLLRAIYSRRPPTTSFDWRGGHDSQGTLLSDRIEHWLQLTWTQLVTCCLHRLWTRAVATALDASERDQAGDDFYAVNHKWTAKIRGELLAAQARADTRDIDTAILRQILGVAEGVERPVRHVASPTKYLLFFDGGSRGNPGPGGSGSVIVRVGPEPELVWAAAMAYGQSTTTNNLAEFFFFFMVESIALHLVNCYSCIGFCFLSLFSIRWRALKPANEGGRPRGAG